MAKNGRGFLGSFGASLLAMVVWTVLVTGISKVSGIDWNTWLPSITLGLVAGLILGPYTVLVAPKVIPWLQSLGSKRFKKENAILESEVSKRLEAAVKQRLKAQPVHVFAAVEEADWFENRIEVTVRLFTNLSKNQTVDLCSPDNRTLRLELSRPLAQGNANVELFWTAGSKTLTVHEMADGGSLVTFLATETRSPEVASDGCNIVPTKVIGYIVCTERRVRVEGSMNLHLASPS